MSDTITRRTIKRRRGDATVRVHFADGAMLFGTSYRTWWDQLGEYCRRFRKRPIRVEISSTPWIGYGGLKWCPVEEFQNQLDIEGAGRTVSMFGFRALNRIELNCLKSEGLAK